MMKSLAVHLNTVESPSILLQYKNYMLIPLKDIYSLWTMKWFNRRG